MNPTLLDELTIPGYTIRSLRPDDAQGVTRLVQLIYQDSYFPTELYDPEEIIRLNEAGKLVSVVALEATGRVVGHYALERPHLGPVAEGSDAIVEPEHRHHHLLEQMRVLLRAAGLRQGLTGVVGYPVTNHVYSQKAEEHFGAHPCGMALGLWPASFHNMPEPLSQRMSFVMYFKYLRPPQYVVHSVTPHQEICAKISSQFAIPLQAAEPGPLAAPRIGPGQIGFEYEPLTQAGVIRVRQIGTDSAAEIRRLSCELLDLSGAKAITLELPLAQPGVADLIREAEKDGFFFCGLGPAFAVDGDALLMQHVAEPIDPALLQVENPLARELLDYVVRERQRLAKALGK